MTTEAYIEQLENEDVKKRENIKKRLEILFIILGVVCFVGLFVIAAVCFPDSPERKARGQAARQAEHARTQDQLQDIYNKKRTRQERAARARALQENKYQESLRNR